MNTRLVWVVLFAVVVGLLVLFSLRSLQSGTAANKLVTGMSAAQQLLARQHPDIRFELRLARPAPGIVNLVVNIEPPHTESTLVTTLVSDAEEAVRQSVGLTRFDTLVIAIASTITRIVPARDTTEMSNDSGR
ncbi:MAG: hypothetical protein ABIK86_04800 [candidate division WOR-3 bacterium]